MKKVLFLVSGGGGTMKFIHQVSLSQRMPYKVIGIIGDRDCGAIDYGLRNNIYTLVVSHWNEKTELIIETLKSINPDIIITNIHKILHPKILNCCNAVFINLHYSLLPAFGGVIGFKTLELAKKQNARIIGATCHFVTEEVDAGKIISQAAIAVNWEEETIDDIQNNIFRMACKIILSSILSLSGLDEKRQFVSSDCFLYSPSLNYDDSFIDESLWSKLTIAQ